VASRVEVHAFPDGEESDEYILLDRDGAARRPGGAQAIEEASARLRSSRDFEIVVDAAGVLLVKRAGSLRR
jgi:hypothetical protein